MDIYNINKRCYNESSRNIMYLLTKKTINHTCQCKICQLGNIQGGILFQSLYPIKYYAINKRLLSDTDFYCDRCLDSLLKNMKSLLNLNFNLVTINIDNPIKIMIDDYQLIIH